MSQWSKIKLQPSTKKALSWIVSTIVMEWKLAILVFVFMIVGAFLAPLAPLILREILDKGLQGSSNYSLLTLLIAYAAMPLLTGLVMMGKSYFLEVFTEYTANRLRIELYEKIQRKNLTFYVRNKAGQLQQRVLQEPGQMNSGIGGLIVQFVYSILLAISTLATMYYLNPMLTLIAILFVPITLIPGPISARWTVPLNVKSMDARAEASSNIQESLSASGILLIKTSGTYSQDLNNFAQTLKCLTHFNLVSVLWMEGTAVLSNFAFILGPVLIFWIASIEMTSNAITIGTVVAFTTYLNQLSDPLKSISKAWAKIPWLLTMINRLLEYRDDVDELKYPEKPLQLQEVKGAIIFENVSFYHDAQRPILSGVSAIFQPGETIALVGESGAGKTTMAYLICRLADPVEGRILLDGQDLRLYSAESLSRFISFVPQEPFLFHTTIRENIAYGCPDATLEIVIDAAKQAQIHDVIMSMPNQYDTIVGERGFKLSTGEKQRIALARVFLRDSRIVILDEVTSALDAISETAIKKALANLLRGRTAFIIAHRLSTIVDADRILVLEQGRIMEEGDFVTLSSADGFFNRLYREQMSGHVEVVKSKLA